LSGQSRCRDVSFSAAFYEASSPYSPEMMNDFGLPGADGLDLRAPSA